MRDRTNLYINFSWAKLMSTGRVTLMLLFMFSLLNQGFYNEIATYFI